MFDPETAAFLKTAPSLPGLDPESLPQRLTKHFAALVARRLRAGETAADAGGGADEWSLGRIADTYELITSIHDDEQVRRASAFVAGTAQQILAQAHAATADAAAGLLVSRDHVDPGLAAALLFLAAEQYADAHEAAQKLEVLDDRDAYAITLLSESTRDLAGGRLASILDRADRRPARFRAEGNLEARATTALFEALLVGVELFAAELLGEAVPSKIVGRFDTAAAAFSRVLALSVAEAPVALTSGTPFITTYPGPRHLAALLLSAYDATAQAAVTKTPPPSGIDEALWRTWLRHRANEAPFCWKNHRDAVARRFHHAGKSAVLILPTGAGKTTASCLKIAATLAAGRDVVFIAPTHTLVDQLTADLQKIFPQELIDSLVSSDFDRLFATDTTFNSIEVMTPERCLALLSFAPEAFQNVGLMVFDECHLLSPVSGLRRALDGMFCVLAFNSLCPNADFLFLSAMIKNGKTFADWIASLTGRECVFVDPLWKPSRQARGIVCYENTALQAVRQAAARAQRLGDRNAGKAAKGLRKAAEDELRAVPWALFGLQHNWLQENTTASHQAKLSDGPVQLGGAWQYKAVQLKPNVNEVAAHIAASAAQRELKTIIFVNVKAHTVSTARAIADRLALDVGAQTEDQPFWQALETELGSMEHSLLSGPASAVPHNADMIGLERTLAERLFRRADGARVIVATPTLAQGLNLPARMAILASDMRADPDEGGREALQAHELLNAAARAGRAGHLANGVVLLIPERVIGISTTGDLGAAAKEKLKAILPEDDRCLEMSDPLQVILDRISVADIQNADVEYVLNRLVTAIGEDGEEAAVEERFPVTRSFAAYTAAQAGRAGAFAAQIDALKATLRSRRSDADDATLTALAAQSGASIPILARLRGRLAEEASLPQTILAWSDWIIDWLADDEEARLGLLGRERSAILKVAGLKSTTILSADAIRRLRPGLRAWLAGDPLCAIEAALGSDITTSKHRLLPRARRLVTALVPMGLSFIAGLVSRTAMEVPEIGEINATPRAVIETLPAAVRRGFDTPAKLAFDELKKGLLSRVQTHRVFAETVVQEPMFGAEHDYNVVLNAIRFYISQ